MCRFLSSTERTRRFFLRLGCLPRPLKKARKKFGSKAELCIWLPPKWKLDTTSLKSAKWRWPVDWLRNLAAYPHNNNAWYKPPGKIICMEEPPKPFARGVKFSSMLLITAESPENMVEHPDGTRTALYNLVPLFESERQFEKKNGIPALLQAFLRKQSFKSRESQTRTSRLETCEDLQRRPNTKLLFDWH